MRRIALAVLLLTAGSLAAQTVTPSQSVPSAPEEPAAAHGIDQVDTAPVNGAIATPLPQQQRRRLRKYDIPELTGARQALGSQLIDGRLPKPRLDYVATDNGVTQRISFFEGDLVIVRMSGAGGTMVKRLILPRDAAAAYLGSASAEKLTRISPTSLPQANDRRAALLRVYGDDGKYVERRFDPTGVVPRELHVQLLPLQDLLRAISEDRTVTSTVAGYAPKAGDELVADDNQVYRVVRVVADSGLVELRAVSQPTVLYVSKDDLYNYFVGAHRVTRNEGAH